MFGKWRLKKPEIFRQSKLVAHNDDACVSLMNWLDIVTMGISRSWTVSKTFLL